MAAPVHPKQSQQATPLPVQTNLSVSLTEALNAISLAGQAASGAGDNREYWAVRSLSTSKVMLIPRQQVKEQGDLLLTVESRGVDPMETFEDTGYSERHIAQVQLHNGRIIPLWLAYLDFPDGSLVAPGAMCRVTPHLREIAVREFFGVKIADLDKELPIVKIEEAPARPIPTPIAWMDVEIDPDSLEIKYGYSKETPFEAKRWINVFNRGSIYLNQQALGLAAGYKRLFPTHHVQLPAYLSEKSWKDVGEKVMWKVKGVEMTMPKDERDGFLPWQKLTDAAGQAKLKGNLIERKE